MEGRVKEIISVPEAAKEYGFSMYDLRKGIATGKYNFGVAIKNGKKYTYRIFTKRLEKFLKGEDM